MLKHNHSNVVASATDAHHSLVMENYSNKPIRRLCSRCMNTHKCIDISKRGMTEKEILARKLGIPEGIELKHWNHTSAPIIIVGSAFDPGSLGKWIYDWTISFYGPDSTITGIASRLWVLLIEFYAKLDLLDNIRMLYIKDYIATQDLHRSSASIIDRFEVLLDQCHESMLRSMPSTSRILTHESALQMINTLFDKDRSLNKTRRIMRSMKEWILDYDIEFGDS